MTEQAVSQPVARFENVKGYLSKHTNLVTFIVLALALAGLTDGASLSIDSIRNLAVAESIRAFAALGVGMIIITRGIDLSIGAVVCLVASVSASFAQNADYASAIYPGVEFPLWLPIVAGIATGAGCHEDTLAGVRAHQTERLQHGDRLAQAGAADAQRFRKIALGRQGFPARVGSVGNQPLDVLGGDVRQAWHAFL